MKNYFKLAWISFVILLICFVFAMLSIFTKISIFQYFTISGFVISFSIMLYVLFRTLLYPIMKDLFFEAEKLDNKNKV